MTEFFSSVSQNTFPVLFRHTRMLQYDAQGPGSFLIISCHILFLKQALYMNSSSLYYRAEEDDRVTVSTHRFAVVVLIASLSQGQKPVSAVSGINSVKKILKCQLPTVLTQSCQWAAVHMNLYLTII